MKRFRINFSITMPHIHITEKFKRLTQTSSGQKTLGQHKKQHAQIKQRSQKASHLVRPSSQFDDRFYSSASSRSSAHTLSILTALLLLWRSGEGGRAAGVTGALLTWHHAPATGPHCGTGWETDTITVNTQSEIITKVLNDYKVPSICIVTELFKINGLYTVDVEQRNSLTIKRIKKSGKIPWRNVHILKLYFKTGLGLHLHLVDAFIQSDLQMRTMEAIKINTCKVFLFVCEFYNK